MISKTKKIIISYIALLMTVFFTLGITSVLKASASETANAQEAAFASFSMIEGASIRNAENDTAKNGLRFGISMTKTEYEQIKSNTDYSDVVYGVLIAPEDMHKTNALNETNVFGENAKYDWATWSDENGWEYNGSESKTRIINITSAELSENAPATDSDHVGFWGSIINIKDDSETNNLAREFRGVGYVKYTKDGQTYYKFAADNDNVRSIAYVAQLAIKNGNGSSDWLQKNYVDKVTDVSSKYTVEYYLQQSDNTFVKDESASEVISTATIDDNVTAEAKTFDNYAFDEDNDNNVISGKVFANDKLVLKRYYKLNVTPVNDTTVNLADTKGDFDFATMLSSNEKTQAANLINNTTSLGSLTLEINGAEVTDVTTLEGVYTVTAKRSGITLYTGKVDFYNSEDGMVWVDNNKLSLDNAHVKVDGMTKEIKSGENLPEGATASQYYYITGGENIGTYFVFSASAIHTKAYYEMWKDKGVDNLVYDVYLDNATGSYFYNIDKYSGASGSQHFSLSGKTWTSVSISFENVLSKFDMFANEHSDYSGSNNNMFAKGDGSYDCKMYIGNFRAAVDGAVTDTSVNLADTKGDFDFATMLSSNEKTQAANLINNTTNLGKLTLEINGKAVTDVTTIEGVYTVTAKRSGITLYTGEVDFYNRDDGMVWVENNNLSLDNAHVKVSGMTKEIKSANLPEGATASQYYYITNTQTESKILAFAISATHSKEYYQMWKDGGVESLLIDCYETTTGGYFRNFEKGEMAFNTTKNGWYKLEFSLEKLINVFDSLASDNATYLCNMLCEGEAAEVKIFVGNFYAKMSESTENAD